MPAIPEISSAASQVDNSQNRDNRGTKPAQGTQEAALGRQHSTGTFDAAHTARTIFDHFRAYRREFATITAAARSRFLCADWRGVQAASAERLDIYGRHIDAILKQISVPQADCAQSNAAFWPDTKRRYRHLIAERPDGELAETVFNSVYRRITDNAHPVDEHLFVRSSFVDAPPPSQEPVFTTYTAVGEVEARTDETNSTQDTVVTTQTATGLVESDQPMDGRRGKGVSSTHAAIGNVEGMIRRLLKERVGAVEWRSLEGDVANVLASLTLAGIDPRNGGEIEIDAVNPLFYRNKGAYIVARLRQAGRTWPMALPLALDDSGKVFVDALICNEDELSIVFSFTRAYFMVSSSYPCGLVKFLHELLPNKKRSEIYASIGEHRHGKTEFYRDFLNHLNNSDDQFAIAPGIKGTVMTVFTLPSFQTVFKIIKDRFAPPKDVTASDVRNRYHMVKGHDRVGRMADTQEFENLRLPLDRLAPALLDELRTVAGSSVAIEGKTVLIAHLYTERLMTPLNLHIETAAGDALVDALDEYGNAIKQLAAANIFPGDMLLKNFGVTRHGRVVFYDYDEICYLTDVNFRAIPEPRSIEEEMAAEPWYSVAPNDVFPEELRRFLFGKPETRHLFEQLHGDLFDPGYWRDLQGAVSDGQVIDVYPYRRKKRFPVRC